MVLIIFLLISSVRWQSWRIGTSMRKKSIKLNTVRTPEYTDVGDGQSLVSTTERINSKLSANKRWTKECSKIFQSNPKALFLYDRMEFPLAKAYGSHKLKILLNPVTVLCHHVGSFKIRWSFVGNWQFVNKMPLIKSLKKWYLKDLQAKHSDISKAEDTKSKKRRIINPRRSPTPPPPCRSPTPPPPCRSPTPPHFDWDGRSMTLFWRK